MDTGLFIALLNPAIALALSAAFLTLWFYQRERPYLAVLAVAYAATATGFRRWAACCGRRPCWR